MKVVTSKEMREIDRITIEEYGISSTVLMERAGLSVALKVKELFPDNKKILILCGGGNNGGDGLVVARNLYNWGFKVNALIFAKKDALSPDCNTQYQIAKNMGVPIDFRSSINERDVHGAVVVDAIFGTGLNRPVEEDFAEIFAFINNSEALVISVDIPSGISSDTGKILAEAIKADYTVTFGLPKRGHFLYPGREFTGKLFIEDIGFPARLLLSDKLNVELINKESVSQLIPQRLAYSHKGDYGHVLVVAGSAGKVGAALMAAKACLRSGAGLVTLAVPKTLIDVFHSRVTEEMTLPLSDDGSGMLSLKAADEILKYSQKIDVIAIGPGIGVSKETEKLIIELIKKSAVPMVIDADAINALARSIVSGQGSKDIFHEAKSPIIFTPHPGEMARLFQILEIKSQKSEEKELQVKIQQDRINTATIFSKKTGTYLILKGAPTIVSEPNGNVFINTTGNPGMATAGSGDVLTGIIASMLGQRVGALEASLFGVYIHGLAGDLAARKKGEHSLIASDIINFLPDAFLSLLS